MGSAWEWIDQSLAHLAVKYASPLNELVSTGRLRLSFLDNKLDRIDIHSASLLAAALARRQSLFLSLPDANPRRPAFLLAFALLTQWWRDHELGSKHGRTVLYCGAHTGIRDQLARVSVSGISDSLAEVFDQLDLSRAGVASSAPGAHANSALPRVVTAYAPADPRSLITKLRPTWIAVDSAASPSLSWLTALLQAARESQIPVFGWGTNPMSSVIPEFASTAHVVRWPFSRSFDSDLVVGRDENAELLFKPFIVSVIRPLLVSSPALPSYGEGLRRAGQALARIGDLGADTFAQLAVQHHWRLYRTLEQLHVPYPFHEIEASRFWGISTIEKQIEVCRKLQDSLSTRSSHLTKSLDDALEALSETAESIRSADPPFWSALIDLVHQGDESNVGRLITFMSRARKELFLLALLSHRNLTSADLQTRRNWVVSIDEIESTFRSDLSIGSEQSFPEALTPRPIVVGIPSAPQYPRLFPLLLFEDVQVLAHDFQARAFGHKAKTWIADSSPDIRGLGKAISLLSPLPERQAFEPVLARMELAIGSEIEVETEGAQRNGDASSPIWSGSDMKDELAWLFEQSEDREITDDAPDGSSGSTGDQSAWVHSAISIRFTGGWFGTFDPEDRLNFLDLRSYRCDERYVRSLRMDDSVLIVPHQKRQSLYALVISAVHKHAAIALHLAILKRWHEELLVGYQQWKSKIDRRGSYATAELLHQIQARGSRLSSPLALHFWITGATLCPSEELDVRRIGIVLERSFLVDQYRRIAASAARIRGLHRGLANRLNRWLADQATGFSESHDRQVIDQETGLTFGELRSSFVIAKITHLESAQGLFLKSDLGRIHQEGQR